MIKFAKGHAYGNDFLYVQSGDAAGLDLTRFAREICDRHHGVGADGLIVYDVTRDGASMRLFNADGSRAEVSGNGVRALAALLLRADHRPDAEVAVETEGGTKRLTLICATGRSSRFARQWVEPADLRRQSIGVGAESVDLVVLNMGNPPGDHSLGRCPTTNDSTVSGRRSSVTGCFPKAPTWNLRTSRRPTVCASASGSAVSVRPRRQGLAPAHHLWPRRRLAGGAGCHRHRARRLTAGRVARGRRLSHRLGGDCL